MKKLGLYLSTCLMLCFTTSAFAIPVGTFGELTNWATGASRLAGTGGTYAGVDPLAGLVGDDLTDGAINIGLTGTDSFLIEFASGIQNTAGNDFVIFDGRFSYDGIFITINGVELEAASSIFVDSGLNLTLKNTALGFDLYGASLDLSAFGVAEGDSIYSMAITSYSGTQADIMGIAGLATASVPEPASLALLGLGLAGFGFGKRRKSV